MPRLTKPSHKGYNSSTKYNCDNCGKEAWEKNCHYIKKVRHFCGRDCYTDFRKYKLPKEEHHRYGTGLELSEVKKRAKARSILNHYLRDKKITRPKCQICGEKSEAHHDNYDNPLDVKWLCFKHHRLYHKIGNKVFETTELLNP